jgi:hypothetical protein
MFSNNSTRGVHQAVPWSTEKLLRFAEEVSIASREADTLYYGKSIRYRMIIKPHTSGTDLSVIHSTGMWSALNISARKEFLGEYC